MGGLLSDFSHAKRKSTKTENLCHIHNKKHLESHTYLFHAKMKNIAFFAFFFNYFVLVTKKKSKWILWVIFLLKNIFGGKNSGFLDTFKPLGRRSCKRLHKYTVHSLYLNVKSTFVLILCSSIETRTVKALSLQACDDLTNDALMTWGPEMNYSECPPSSFALQCCPQTTVDQNNKSSLVDYTCDLGLTL